MGLRVGRAFRLCQRRLQSAERVCQGRLRTLRRKCHASAVVAGTVHLPYGFEFSLLSQAESARPFTLTTPVDVNGFGDALDDRAVVNGVQTGMDQFRGTPYMQTDIRVSRPFRFHEHWQVIPFIEIFNLFNRNNPGANYVTESLGAAGSRKQSGERHGISA